MKQLELDVNMPAKYNIHGKSGFCGPVIQVATEEEAWEVIGRNWAPYKVTDENGNIRPEFVPF